jgi:hypothetical protein
LENRLQEYDNRYGLEGLVRFEKSSAPVLDEVNQVFVTPKGTKLKIFDKVRVSMEIDATLHSSGQLVMQLIESP